MGVALKVREEHFEGSSEILKTLPTGLRLGVVVDIIVPGLVLSVTT